MPATAEYEVLIPVGVAHEQSVATHALQYAQQYFAPESREPIMGHVDSRQVLINGHIAPHDVLVLKAEDSPYTDSFVKQMASYVADVTGAQTITVSKHGKNGIQVWPVRNLA